MHLRAKRALRRTGGSARDIHDRGDRHGGDRLGGATNPRGAVVVGGPSAQAKGGHRIRGQLVGRGAIHLGVDVLFAEPHVAWVIVASPELDRELGPLQQKERWVVLVVGHGCRELGGDPRMTGSLCGSIVTVGALLIGSVKSRHPDNPSAAVKARYARSDRPTNGTLPQMSLREARPASR
jgi:hypothetical protein